MSTHRDERTCAIRIANQGFTLLELVVVLLIIAVLAGIALPKFTDIADQAHRASVETAGGSLLSAVSLVQAQWRVNGTNSAVQNISGYGGPNNVVDVSASGWPTGVDGNINPGALNVEDCNALWHALMTTNSMTASISAGSDYLTSVNGGDCRYTYQATTDGHHVQYDPENGEVQTVIAP